MYAAYPIDVVFMEHSGSSFCSILNIIPAEVRYFNNAVFLNSFCLFCKWKTSKAQTIL